MIESLPACHSSLVSNYTVQAEREGRFPNEFHTEAEEIFFVINRECEVIDEPNETADYRGHNATQHNQITILQCMDFFIILLQEQRNDHYKVTWNTAWIYPVI